MNVITINEDATELRNIITLHSNKPPIMSSDPITEQTTTSTITEKSNHSDDKNITVFYNVFVSDKDKSMKAIAYEIADEQIRFIRTSEAYPTIDSIEYITIATNMTLDCEKCHHLAHFDSGWETVTLQPLHAHCSKEENRNKSVIYIHNKGSFHRGKKKWRNWLMQGVFSRQCYNLPDQCNACAIAIHTGPHIHVHGNMFMARFVCCSNVLWNANVIALCLNHTI